MTAEQLQHLLTETAPLLELEGVDRAEDEAHWNLMWLNGLTMLLEFEEVAQRATIEVCLGELPDSGVNQLCRIFLGYNAFWYQTGGAHIAVDAENAILMIYGFDVRDLDIPALHGLLTGIADKASTWIDLIRDFEPDSTGSETAMSVFPLELLEHGVRV